MSRRAVTPLAGRTAVITGAASGIGRALAIRLAQHGCPVAIADQDVEVLVDKDGKVSVKLVASADAPQ